MMSHHRPLLVALTMLALAGCTAAETPPSAETITAQQPFSLHGSFHYTNGIFLTYYQRHAVALVDLHGLASHDPAWRVPPESLQFGRLEIDRDNSEATYQIDLPLRPDGESNDLDGDGKGGVKLYAVAYWSDPFHDDDTIHGWPTYITSLQLTAGQGDVVKGGKLVAWAPDASQQIPSDFGGDGLLFTKDDPLQPLPAGYSVIDLSTRPFGISRDTEGLVDLYEGQNQGTQDLSALSYRKAFERLFVEARQRYAFNEVAGKEPDWDALFRSVAPMVIEAQQKKDATLFFAAIRAFANGIPDGHTAVSGGSLEDNLNDKDYGGGYGLAIRETDDGAFVVVYVKEGGPADKAGVKRGATLERYDAKPVEDTLKTISPPTGPFSTQDALRYDQVRYLLRGPVGATAQLTYTNPGESAAKTTLLTAVDEYSSLSYTSIYRGSDPTAPPVEYWILDSGFGYVRVNSNDDDIDLIDELFERALKSFEYNEVPGIVIDMRQNSGGTNLDLAGYLSKDSIPLAGLVYFNPITGHFEDGEGDLYIEEVQPSEQQYHFDQIALLVGPACFSACELEAYGFSKLPGAQVVGYGPTAGVEAEVSEGSFKLPDGIYLQIPTGRFVNADGTLFLEGAGVKPTVVVPQNRDTLLSDDDEVLKAAEDALLDETNTTDK